MKVMPARYTATNAIDQKITHAYTRFRQGDRRALSHLRREIGWSKSTIGRRAAQLRLTRVKEQPWCQAEEDLLERYGYLTAPALQKRLLKAGFARSCAAVQLKVMRLRIKQNLDGYSACALALAFGVDVHKVCRWISRGLLQAKPRGTGRTAEQGGDSWWIPIAAVRRFVLSAPEEIDLARVEKFWFLDLVTEGKICR